MCLSYLSHALLRWRDPENAEGVESGALEVHYAVLDDRRHRVPLTGWSGVAELEYPGVGEGATALGRQRLAGSSLKRCSGVSSRGLQVAGGFGGLHLSLR